MYRKYVTQQLKNTIIITRPYFEKLCDAYQEPIKIKQTTTAFEPREDNKKYIIDGLNNKRKYIQNEYKKLTTMTNIEMKMEDTTIKINIYHTKNEDEIIKKCVRRIYSMIKVFGVKNKKIYDGMEISIMLYTAPRVMTGRYKRTPEEMNNINEGCYFNCVCGYVTIEEEKFKMVVTRKNGCLGLLTHEMGHICELDLGSYDGKNYNFPNDRLKKWEMIVRKYFDVSTRTNIGKMIEGINNGNSSIIHAMFTAIEMEKKDKLRTYIKCYENEFLYAHDMLGKYMKWFRYKRMRDIYTKREKRCRQKSMMMEYILVRSIYLLNFDRLHMMKIGDDTKRIKDDEYIKKFMRCMLESEKILDDMIFSYKNDDVISMEYYYYS